MFNPQGSFLTKKRYPFIPKKIPAINKKITILLLLSVHCKRIKTIITNDQIHTEALASGLVHPSPKSL
jgi:hypothetical protein